MSFVNNMGGTKSQQCNEIAKKMWLWCIEKKIWLSSNHLPGIRNVTADKKSREFIMTKQSAWMLCSSVFKDLTHLLLPGNP